MNSETLHALARAVRDDIAVTQTQQHLNSLLAGLTAQANNPADAGAQQQVSDALTQLRTALPTAPSNAFSPAWRQYLVELDMARYLGRGLLDQLEGIFFRNQITVAVARDELQAIADRVIQLDAVLSQIIGTSEFLGVGADTLAPGECVVGFTIPREFVHNEVAELGKEFEEIRRIIGPLMELANGSRDELHVKSISSSNFTVLLVVGGNLALLLSKVTAFVLDQYGKLVAIRKIQAEQQALGLPADVLSQTAQFAQDSMDQAIGGFADELVAAAQNVIDEGRAYELRMEVRRSMQSLAYRVDHNVNIEIRVEPPALVASEDPEEVAHQEETAAKFAEIKELASKIEFNVLPGTSILSLPAYEDGAVEEGDQPAAEV